MPNEHPLHFQACIRIAAKLIWTSPFWLTSHTEMYHACENLHRTLIHICKCHSSNPGSDSNLLPSLLKSQVIICNNTHIHFLPHFHVITVCFVALKFLLLNDNPCFSVHKHTFVQFSTLSWRRVGILYCLSYYGDYDLERQLTLSRAQSVAERSRVVRTLGWARHRYILCKQ